MKEMYPFLTPSIWRSIHQTPGTPSMSHSEAFLPKDPIGSHCKTKKQPKVTVSKMGRRTRKRNR